MVVHVRFGGREESREAGFSRLAGVQLRVPEGWRLDDEKLLFPMQRELVHGVEVADVAGRPVLGLGVRALTR